MDKFDSIMEGMSSTNVTNLIKKDFFDIDILEYINKYLNVSSNDDALNYLKRFIDFSKFVKYNNLGSIIAIDGKEHKIGNDFIYIVE